MELSLIFKNIRRYKKWTQAEFANKIAVSRSSIAQIETNNNKPSRNMILNILETISLPEQLKNELKSHLSELEKITEKDNALNILGFEFSSLNTSEKESYNLLSQLWFYRNILLTISITLKNNHDYKFDEEEVKLFKRVENRINLLTPAVLLSRGIESETIYKISITLEDLKSQVKKYSHLINSKFENEIRTLDDLFESKNYDVEDIPF
jgi:transcriptional regulator with XRE-family HTH domain